MTTRDSEQLPDRLRHLVRRGHFSLIVVGLAVELPSRLVILESSIEMNENHIKCN